MICQSPSFCPAAPGRCPALSEPYWSEPAETLVWGEFVFILEGDTAVSVPKIWKKKAFLAAFLNSVWQDAKDRNQTPDSFWIHHLQLVSYHCLCERHWASSVTRLLIFLVKCVFWRWTLDVLLDGQDLCQRFLNMVLKDKKQTHTCRYDR